MTHDEAVKTTSIKKKSDLSKKNSSFFSVKMLRYTLIKMLKSPSTYVMFVLTFVVGLIIIILMSTSMADSPSGEYGETAKSLFTIYAWIWYVLYFGLTSMFIGFKAVQLVRDEIDDGTLLIFSSIPISRTRMIIEKWLALQFLCLVYSVIILLVQPLISLGMGPKGLALGKVILSKVNFMILTSFILQLFLTTIGILISLGLNSKGVIGILFTIGFLTVIGAMIPFIYNSTKLSNKSSAYLMQATDLAKNPVKFNDSELIKTYHNMLDPAGWPVWGYYNNMVQLNINSSLDAKMVGSFNVTSLANDINVAIQKALANNPGATKVNWDQFTAEVKNNPTNYPNLAKLINNYVLEFDGYNPKPFTETENNIDKVQFFNNTDKGINILGEFYRELSSGKPLVISSAKPSSSSKLNLNQLDESKLTNNTSKQIYQIMKTMYDKGVFLPTIMGYDYNSYNFNQYNHLLAPQIITNFIVASLSDDSRKHFSNFNNSLMNFLTKNLYLQNVYLNDPVMSIYYQFVSQMYYWLKQGAYAGFSGNSIFDDKTKATSELQKITSAQKEYKLMAYLNIWQQWVIMWTGDARASIAAQDNILSSMLLPLNNYLEAKVNNVEYNVNGKAPQTGYFLMADFNRSVTLTSLTGMYVGYLLVTVGLAAITLWWITRKDFV